MKCLGTVALAIAGVFFAFVGLLALAIGLLWLTEQTVALLSMQQSMIAHLVTYVAYVAIGFGGYVGIVTCWERG